MNRSPTRRLIWFSIVLIAWLALDLVSKGYVFHAIVPDRGQVLTIIDGYLRFTHVRNTGAVWGSFRDYETLLFVFNLIVTPFLLGFFLYSILHPGYLVSRCNVYFVTSIALIMGGALGNLVDRVVFGFVRDFIDVVIPIIEFNWPVFNVADAGITVGASVLALYILMYPPENGSADQENAG